MTKRERLEDLGEIKCMLSDVLDSPMFKYSKSKHDFCDWPECHIATFHYSLCDYCNLHASVCATSDWNWPGKRMTTGPFGEREI